MASISEVSSSYAASQRNEEVTSDELRLLLLLLFEGGWLKERVRLLRRVERVRRRRVGSRS